MQRDERYITYISVYMYAIVSPRCLDPHSDQVSFLNQHSGAVLPHGAANQDAAHHFLATTATISVCPKIGYPKFDAESMGVSENSVPLHPMVNDHYPY